MLTQVQLELEGENQIQLAATRHGVTATIEDCKSFNATGMSLLIQLTGDGSSINTTISEIRRSEGVRQVIEGRESEGSVPVLVVMDRPAVCRASSDSAIICLECPLNYPGKPATWRFIARKGSDLRQIISKIRKEGIASRIVEVAPLEQRPDLTGRQKEIVATALANGYFEFPRRLSLTALSRMVGVKPSTLSEILRSAERRIVTNAVGLGLEPKHEKEAKCLLDP